LLRLLLASFDDNSRFAFLSVLLKRCPYQSTTAQLLYLLKEETHHATFSSSRFWSPSLLQLLEHFHFNAKSSSGADSVLSRSELLQQLLNFYRYLLLTQKRQRSQLLDRHRKQRLRDNFLSPLQTRLQKELEQCQVEPSAQFHRHHQQMMKAVGASEAASASVEQLQRTEKQSQTTLLMVLDSLNAVLELLNNNNDNDNKTNEN
jgi:hypothetical protein